MEHILEIPLQGKMVQWGRAQQGIWEVAVKSESPVYIKDSHGEWKFIDKTGMGLLGLMAITFDIKSLTLKSTDSEILAKIEERFNYHIARDCNIVGHKPNPHDPSICVCCLERID